MMILVAGLSLSASAQRDKPPGQDRPPKQEPPKVEPGKPQPKPPKGDDRPKRPDMAAAIIVRMEDLG